MTEAIPTEATRVRRGSAPSKWISRGVGVGVAIMAIPVKPIAAPVGGGMIVPLKRVIVAELLPIKKGSSSTSKGPVRVNESADRSTDRLRQALPSVDQCHEA
ncbi:MAG: hypothetical protein AAGG07_13950 [Planctomycetota bacterium]